MARLGILLLWKKSLNNDTIKSINKIALAGEYYNISIKIGSYSFVCLFN